MLVSVLDQRHLRLVTHLDVDDDDVDRAASVLGVAATGALAGRRPSSGGSWRHRGGERPQVVVDQRLRAVAQRLLGVRVDVDDDAVRADRDGRPGQRHDQVAPAAGVRRVDDHRQVRERRARPAPR